MVLTALLLAVAALRRSIARFGLNALYRVLTSRSPSVILELTVVHKVLLNNNGQKNFYGVTQVPRSYYYILQYFTKGTYLVVFALLNLVQ